MAAEPSLQRAYRAPCPGCGAPVEFRSAQSTHAVCAYCQSTVARSGETLSRVGKMAELFDDHSPLQLQASGVWKGKAFTLVGRLQYKYAEGSWTEWHAVLEDGSSAFLSEDNGAYVFATNLEIGRELPSAERFRVGTTTAIKGKSFSVASNNQVALLSAQGELPRLPQQGQWFAMVELRSQGGGDGAHAAAEVLSIDYGCQPATVSSGHSVLLDELKLTGLRDEAVKNESGRHFDCPNCGAQLTPLLASSKTLSCAACHSIIDLSQGIGAELKHALQDEPVTPLIPLGSQGPLQGALWQVVGFQHRMGSEPSDPDEQFGWEEYLLYNTKRGFIFLVDSTEGWSVVQPCTGAPEMSEGQGSASYRGVSYQLKESYNAETTYVAGEFYWQVSRGQKTWNRDFVNGKSLLSMEQSAQEVTWSSGSQIDSDLLTRAFKLEEKKDLLKRSDVGPFSAAKSISVGAMIVLVLLLLLVLMLLSRCASCDPTTQNCTSNSGMRTSGGSFGGYSSGGGHK